MFSKLEDGFYGISSKCAYGKIYLYVFPQNFDNYFRHLQMPIYETHFL